MFARPPPTLEALIMDTLPPSEFLKNAVPPGVVNFAGIALIKMCC